MANVNNIGTYHLADNPQMYDIQRKNAYEFVVTDIDGILKAGSASDRFDNAQEVLRMSIKSAFVPHFAQETVTVRRGNSAVKFAGLPSFEDGELSFHDFVGARTKEILMAWQNLSYNVYDETVGALDVQNYKKDCYLNEYTPDFRLVRSWRLHGCWISALSEDAYDNDDGDKHMISCTITYDRAEVDLSAKSEVKGGYRNNA